MFSEEAGLKFFYAHLLNRFALINREGGGGGGGLAKDHEDGFHADRAVSNVRGRKADGNEEIFALGDFGDDGAVGDGVGRETADLGVAFVLGVAVFHDALAIVRVHGVSGEADCVKQFERMTTIVLGHDVIGNHAAGFADVELMRPAVGVAELVFGEAPGLHFTAHVLGQARAGGEEVQEAARVVDMLLPDLCAANVIGVGVIVIEADKIGGETAVVVNVGFAVGHHLDVHQLAEFWVFAVDDEGFDIADEQFVAGGIVIGRRRDRDLVGRILREAEAEVVGLNAFVAGAGDAAIAGLNDGVMLMSNPP